MFGSSRKTTSTAGNDDRLAEWQRSPSVPVTKATGLKTRLLLNHIGRDLKVMYRNEPRVIRPLSVFRKPAYNRMYVEAQCNGETEIFNISDLLIRRPDSDSYYDDDEQVGRRSALPMLGVLVVLLATGAAAAVYLGFIPVEFNQLLGNRAADPNAPVAPAKGVNKDATRPDEKSPAVVSPNEVAEPSPVEEPTPPAPVPPTTTPTPPSTAIDDPTFGREFSDATGSFRTRAELVEFQPDRGRGSRVILRKADGTQLDVAMNSLSKDDQAWVREEVKRRKTP